MGKYDRTPGGAKTPKGEQRDAPTLESAVEVQKMRIARVIEAAQQAQAALDNLGPESTELAEYLDFQAGSSKMMREQESEMGAVVDNMDRVTLLAQVPEFTQGMSESDRRAYEQDIKMLIARRGDHREGKRVTEEEGIVILSLHKRAKTEVPAELQKIIDQVNTMTPEKAVRGVQHLGDSINERATNLQDDELDKAIGHLDELAGLRNQILPIARGLGLEDDFSQVLQKHSEAVDTASRVFRRIDAGGNLTTPSQGEVDFIAKGHLELVKEVREFFDSKVSE